MILGDCNDTKNSKPLRLLTKRGNTMIAAFTKAVDPQGEVWTYFYRKDDTYSCVDYILVSPGLVPAAVATQPSSQMCVRVGPVPL